MNRLEFNLTQIKKDVWVPTRKCIIIESKRIRFLTHYEMSLENLEQRLLEQMDQWYEKEE